MFRLLSGLVIGHRRNDMKRDMYTKHRSFLLEIDIYLYVSCSLTEHFVFLTIEVFK